MNRAEVCGDDTGADGLGADTRPRSPPTVCCVSWHLPGRCCSDGWFSPTSGRVPPVHAPCDVHLPVLVRQSQGDLLASMHPSPLRP